MFRTAVSFIQKSSFGHNVTTNFFNKNLSIAKMSSIPTYETLAVTSPQQFVFHVELNRPDKLNAFNDEMWRDIRQCFNDLHYNPDCRVIVLSALGRLFTAGLDLKAVMNLAPLLAEQEDVARKAKILETKLKQYQQTITSLEKCVKPVLAAIHSACIGAGINLITAADIRYCTEDAFFQVKEVDIGMAADVGVLQRLPKVIGSDSLARELCYTARKLPAQEALAAGLVSGVYKDKESMLKAVFETANAIASKSPVAVQGTKRNLVFSRDHTVEEGLEHIGLYNIMMLQSEDFTNAAVAQATKQPEVVFSKL